MKLKTVIICVVLIFFARYMPLNAQDRYEYPVTPAMSEWATLSVEEKRNMLQIPEKILHNMPTDVLIQAYTDFPLNSLVFAYNTKQDGFRRVHNEFNGLRELLQREDITASLIEYYKKMTVDGYDVNWQPVEIGKFTFQFTYIELLLSQPEIINQLNQPETNFLIQELITKFERKIDHIDEYSIVGLESSAYAISHILNRNDAISSSNAATDEAVQSFLMTGQLTQGDMLDFILLKARTFRQN